MRTYAAVLIAFAFAAGCAKKGQIAAPPPPLRPTPAPKPAPTAAGPTDCQPNDGTKGLPAKVFQQRSISEAEKLSRDALAKLQTAGGKGLDPATRDQLTRDAVEGFITALLADPYNVNATYNLAAAYARIGRSQCALNLLTRLIQMRQHQSRKDDVEAKLDRLLGRNRTPLDPDFNPMRNDAQFRALIEKMCEGSADPACVFGAKP